MVLRRCTVRFAEPGRLQAMVRANDDAIRSYDVFALEPTTERAFASACTNGRADIVTTQLGTRPAFRLRAPALKAAASAGGRSRFRTTPFPSALVWTSPTGARRWSSPTPPPRRARWGKRGGGGVRDDDDSDDDTDDDTDAVMRVVSASANDERLVNDLSRKFAKRASGGVVLTSGSRQATELRAPHDVANLASLFGMRDENARAR